MTILSFFALSQFGGGSGPRSDRQFRWAPVLWATWIPLAVLGLIGIYLRFTQGHLPAGYGSFVPWGLWVAIYFHGVGIAGGAFVIGAGGYIVDLPGFRSKAMLRTVIVLGFAAILPSFMGVWLDLGHMERAMFIFFSPSFTSMMAFNAWMYNAFVIIAAVCWLLSFKNESLWLKPLLCLAVMLSILFPSQSGAFFGVVDAKPFWHSALLPMLFLASAITAGAAALLVVRAILGPGSEVDGQEEYGAAIDKLRMVTLVGLVVYFIFEFAEFSIALWNPTSHAPAIDLILFGPYWWVFWIVHLLLGGAIPLALLSLNKRNLWTVAALLVAITFMSARLNILVPGQAVGEIQGLQNAFNHPRLNYIYHASVMEYLVGFFQVAAGMAIFFLGQRVSRAISARFETNV
jgi:molybdopterin-containing oxidoreductase family membrane subunit